MSRLRAYLVDDEPLALRRLDRMLRERDTLEIVGACSDPVRAIDEIELLGPDLLFLDIQMPEVTGFDLLARLQVQPLVIFATAYDQYALRAFEVNSVDYLLKPIEDQNLDRALAKLARIAGGESPRPDLQALLRDVRSALQSNANQYLERIPSRTGDRIQLLEVARVTHFYAEDKLTFAATPEKDWIVDRTIADLEGRLDPRHFLRIHRSSIVNLEFVDELNAWFGGRMVVRLRNPRKTEITVARDRLKELKDRLGL
jgi:two-component system LytT family response regulator